MTSALLEVLEKLERATPGPWHYSEKGFSRKPAPMVYATGQDLNYIAMCCDFGNEGPTLNEENAQAIAAAVNWLREHGHALLRDAGDGWRTIESAPKTGLIVDLWANGQRHTTCYWADREWRKCDSKMRTWRMLPDFDPTHWRPLPQPPAMHAPGGAGGGE